MDSELNHEYWRFVDRRNPANEKLFYGVFASDGNLICKLELSNEIIDDERVGQHPFAKSASTTVNVMTNAPLAAE